MSTNEQKLTPPRPPLAARASTDNPTLMQRPATDSFATPHQRRAARRLANRCAAAETAGPRRAQGDATELATVERARPRPSPAETRLPPITVLTADTAMSEAIKAAVGGCHAVFAVGTPEEAAALATAGRCPILITDQALTQPELTRVTTALRAHEPALVTIAVGNRGEDSALIGLLSAGAADRLMLKPVTAALAKIVIESAVREHQAQKARSKPVLAQRTVPAAIAAEPSTEIIDESSSTTLIDEPQPARAVEQSLQPTLRDVLAATEPQTSQMPRKLPLPTWVATVAALTMAAWMAAMLVPRFEQRAAIEANLADATRALDAGRYVDPAERSAFQYFSNVLALDPANAQARAGIDRIADRYVDEAQTLLRGGQLAEAGLAVERARRVRPDHPGLPALDQRLRAGINRILVRVRESEARAAALQPRYPHAAATRIVPDRSATRVTRESKAGGVAVQPSVGTQPGPARGEPARATLPVTQTVALHQPGTARELIDKAQTALDTSLLASVQPPPARAEPGTAAPAPATVEPARPKLAKFVRPEYPNEAAMRGFEGWVDVGLDVTAAGDVIDARVEDSSSGRLFHRAALVAVRQWKYEPRPASEPTRHVQVRLEFKRSQ